MSARTELACLKSAMAGTAYQAGYLEGAIRTAIIRLEYVDPAAVAAELEAALAQAKIEVRHA